MRLEFDESWQKLHNRSNMKNSSAVFSLFFSLAFAAFAQTNADVSPVRSMSLQDCIQESLAHNFDVQVERFDPQISLFALNSAYGGYDPLFSFSGQHNHDKSGAEGYPPYVSDGNTFSAGLGGSLPLGTTYGLNASVSDQRNNALTFGTNSSSGGTVQLSLTQPLLKNFWVDGTRLTINVAKNRLKYSEQSLRQQFITTVSAVENAYYELIFAQENVQVQQEALDLAQTQLTNDQFRVNIGSLAPLDVQQDEAQAASSKAGLISAQNGLSIAQNTLKNLLTDAYAETHGTNIQPTATLEAPLQLFNLQDSWNKGMSERPDLLQARLDVEQQGIQLKFDRNQVFPELDLLGTFGYNGAGTEFAGTFDQFGNADRPFYSYGAQISVPLSNAKARNAVKSDKATMQQVVLKLKQLEQNIMVEIDNAVKSAQSAYESADATRQARVYAEAALDAEQKKYADGKSTTFTVLQLQIALTTARSNEIRALANYNEALSTLAQQEGSTLERNGIDIEAK
jgi:outer membrane protein